MAGGVWNITADGDPESEFNPTIYHWTTFNKHIALRLGTGSSGSYSLIGSSDFTGMQIGWNNHSILSQIDSGQSNESDGFLIIDSNQLRSIEGSGPPAAIAELRFDGEVVARRRIKLDGKFVFENVRMSTDLRKTEVYIYQRSINEKPIKVIDFSQSVSNRALPSGELLIRGGLGQKGNLLNRKEDENSSTTTFGSIIYGLSDRITVEAAMQQNPDTGTPDLLAGTLFSAGSYWTGALYGAKSNRSYATDIRLEGRYRTWSTAYWGKIQNEHFGSEENERTLNHSLRLSLNPLRNIGIQLIARHEVQADSLLRHYVLPALNWAPASWIRLSATPDDDRNYRYETNIRIGDHNNIRANIDRNIISCDYQRDLNEYFKLNILNDYAKTSGDNVTNLVLGWYPGNKNDLIETALSCSDGAIGIAGSWNHSFNTGLRLAMRYTYNMNNATSLDIDNESVVPGSQKAQKSIALSLSWDLGWSNRKLFPVNRSAMSATRGSIAGSLAISNETKLSPSDINNISILLNGRRMQQSQINGSFFVGSLQPGIYTLAVDPEKLPIELVVGKKELKVEVSSGAVTGVNIPVYAEFGVAGRITDSAGNGLANVMIIVADKENKTIVQTLTNEFGYYRADGLRSGTYSITTSSIEKTPVENPPKLPFTIKDNYLFDINLRVENPGNSSSVTSP